MVTREAIEAARAVLPLPELWHKCGWQGEPKKSCHAPYRDDRRASGSVFQRENGSWCFHDFASGESFDEVALLGRMENLSTGEAIRRFCELAGVRREIGGTRPPAPAPPRVERPPRDSRPADKPQILPLRAPSVAECEAIAAVRGLLPDAVQLAAADGLLFIGERLGLPCWVLTDAERWNAQYRRMDGASFVLRDGREAKTLGIRGGWAAWPLGLPLILENDYRLAVLAEGTPDALAAFQVLLETGLASRCAVVCMTGAGLRIPAECLPAFTGRRVRLFSHVGDSTRAGDEAGLRWECQLREAGALVDAFDLRGLLQADGRAVEDLNDACGMAAGERRALGLMEGMTL